MAHTIYVHGKPSADGNFADCTYSKDWEGHEGIPGQELHIPVGAGECVFAQGELSELQLIGATFKTIGSVAGMNASNFAPADDEYAVHIPMPAYTITKGVVLLFSTTGTVENLYPSSDPQVINDQPTC